MYWLSSLFFISDPGKGWCVGVAHGKAIPKNEEGEMIIFFKSFVVLARRFSAQGPTRYMCPPPLITFSVGSSPPWRKAGKNHGGIRNTMRLPSPWMATNVRRM